MKNVKNVAPGYLLLKPYELKSKVGAWQVSADEESAPELGEVLQVGEVITKMPFAAEYLPKVGDIVAYKKYNHFKFALGAYEVYLVHFENYLFVLDTADEQN